MINNGAEVVFFDSTGKECLKISDSASTKPLCEKALAKFRAEKEKLKVAMRTATTIFADGVRQKKAPSIKVTKPKKDEK